MWRHIYGKVWEEVCAFPVTLSDCRSRSFEHKINLILFLIPFISATAEVFVSQISFWNKQSYWGEDVRGLHLFEAIDLPGSLSFTLMEVCKELTLVQISIILCRLFFCNEIWKLLSHKYLHVLEKSKCTFLLIMDKCCDKHLWRFFLKKKKIDSQLLNEKISMSQTSFDAKFCNGSRTYYHFRSITTLFLNWQHHVHGWNPPSPLELCNKSRVVVLSGQWSRSYGSKRALCILEAKCKYLTDLKQTRYSLILKSMFTLGKEGKCHWFNSN